MSSVKCVLRAWLCALGLLLGSLFPSGAAGEEAAGGEAAGETEVELWADFGARYLDDLPGLVERRVLRVLTVHSRTGYFLDGAEQRGITYEVALELEKFLNKDQKIKSRNPLEVFMVPVPHDKLIPYLLEGRGDIVMANMTVTPERAAQVAFSDPLAKHVRELLVTGPSAPVLTTLDDLAGLEVHVRPSSSYYESLETLNGDLAARGLEPLRLVAADEHLEDEDLLELVSSGILPFVVVDEHIAKLWVAVLPDLTLRDDLIFRSDGSIAWAVRPDTPELLAAINRFVPTAKQGTLLGNTLIKRYFKDNKWITNPAETAAVKRLKQAMPFFKAYGAEYGFDWVMVAAQAYQESRIDQSVVSPVGALGVMQIKPTTAADPSVGIPDITAVEHNIHAGVRYLRFIVDTYLADPAIDDTNRLLLAFAGYNAGPGRLGTLRKAAAEQQLDPNVWFGNVEHVAAQKIGRETVTYVKNIAKYYYAYRLIIDTLEAKADD